MRTLHARYLIHGTALAGLAISSLASGANAQTAGRQIDRWLVAAGGAPGTTHPLDGERGRLFPDRDLEMGPGYWRLIREDGASSLDLPSEAVGESNSTLAHAYLRAPHDMTVDVDVEMPACARAAGWINGQSVGELRGPVSVRLAGGWNTLLISVAGEGGSCALAIGATVSADVSAMRRDEDPPDLSAVVVQASRPPGARPNYPGGAVLVSEPEARGLTWTAEGDDLLAEMQIAITTWGRPPGMAVPAGGDRPTGPPEVDLTGDWVITLYTPTGILTGTASFVMAEGGELTGRIEGERLEGDIRDGWVSGDEFGWTIRLGGRGRDIQLRMRGVLTDEAMSGSMDFGGFRAPGGGQFEARFEGERASPEGDETPGEEAGEEEAGEPGRGDDERGAADVANDPETERGRTPSNPRAEMPMIPAPGDPDPATADEDELAAPADPDGLRARIVSVLLPPPEDPPDPAPGDVGVELDIGGGDIVGQVAELAPLRPASISGMVEFRQAISAGVEEDGVEARVRWNDDDYDFVGSVPADGLLRAFHGPIRLSGWGLAGVDGFAGAFRVPEALDGFTLRVGGGEWTVDGSRVDGELCSPCEKGRQFDLEVTGTDDPVVFVSDAGYPEATGDGNARGAGAEDARSWLEALREGPDQYREMARRAGSP